MYLTKLFVSHVLFYADCLFSLKATIWKFVELTFVYHTFTSITSKLSDLKKFD